MSVKTTADRLMAISCKGYWEYTPDGNEFDCEYQNVTDICEHCVCNIGNCYNRLESHRTCRGDSYLACSGEEVVFLEGYRGYFSVDSLRKV